MNDMSYFALMQWSACILQPRGACHASLNTYCKPLLQKCNAELLCSVDCAVLNGTFQTLLQQRSRLWQHRLPRARFCVTVATRYHLPMPQSRNLLVRFDWHQISSQTEKDVLGAPATKCVVG